MGVPQVHSVCFTFLYLSKNNKQLMICYVIALGSVNVVFFFGFVFILNPV